MNWDFSQPILYEFRDEPKKYFWFWNYITYRKSKGAGSSKFWKKNRNIKSARITRYNNFIQLIQYNNVFRSHIFSSQNAVQNMGINLKYGLT